MKLGALSFDQDLSSARRNVVLSLLDHIITFRHGELRAAWEAIYRGEDALLKIRVAGKGPSQSEAWLREAKALVTKAPIDEGTARDKQLNRDFRDLPAVKAKYETEWDTLAKANYIRAKELAEQVQAQAR